jgi:hypothetical protein
VKERALTCIGNRHIGILGDEKIRAGEVAKSRNATVPQSKKNRGQVALEIGGSEILRTRVPHISVSQSLNF